MIPPFLEYVPIFGVVSLDLVLDWNFDDDVLLHGQGYVVRVPKGNRGKNGQAEFTALEEGAWPYLISTSTGLTGWLDGSGRFWIPGDNCIAS